MSFNTESNIISSIESNIDNNNKVLKSKGKKTKEQTNESTENSKTTKSKGKKIKNDIPTENNDEKILSLENNDEKVLSLEKIDDKPTKSKTRKTKNNIVEEKVENIDDKPTKTKGRKTKTKQESNEEAVIKTVESNEEPVIKTIESNEEPVVINTLEDKKSVKTKVVKTKTKTKNVDNIEPEQQLTSDIPTLENEKTKKSRTKKTTPIIENNSSTDVLPTNIITLDKDNETVPKPKGKKSSTKTDDEPSTMDTLKNNESENNELKEQMDDIKRQWSLITSKISILNNDKETLEIQQKQLLSVLVELIKKYENEDTETANVISNTHLGLLSTSSNAFSNKKQTSTPSLSKNKIISIESDSSSKSESESESADEPKQPLINKKKNSQILKTNGVINTIECKSDSDESSESNESLELNRPSLLKKNNIIKKKSKTPILKNKNIQLDSSNDSESE